MFVQVIEGRTDDAASFRTMMGRWDIDVKPSAAGFLGATAGAATDGTAFVFMRFTDEAAAVENQRRPAHSAWWTNLLDVLVEPPVVHESADVALLLDGGSDDAEFVQVVKAASPDRARIDRLMTAERIAAVQQSRPDLIGSIRVWLDDGSFVEAAYFTTESAARDAEESDEYERAEEEFAAAYGPMTFVDLAALVLLSP